VFAEDSDLFKNFREGLVSGIKDADNLVVKLLGGTNNFKQIQEIQSALALAGGDFNLQKS
jgi:hypothetical protein